MPKLAIASQQKLFAGVDVERSGALMDALDACNRCFRCGAVVPGPAGFGSQ